MSQLPNHTGSFQYDLAEGPQALEALLQQYLMQAKEPAFAEAKHYVLYRCGQQQALMQVETHTMPFHFFYTDLWHRPPTQIVKNIIAQFLWKHCGEAERYIRHCGEVVPSENAQKQYYHDQTDDGLNRYFVATQNIAKPFILLGAPPFFSSSPATLEEAYMTLERLKQVSRHAFGKMESYHLKQR